MFEHITFLPHTAHDPAELSHLLDLCFGPDRHQKTASHIRADASRIESASFVARIDDQLVGSVECWHIDWQHKNQRQPMALLGPLAAHPDRRRQRIGMQLMDRALPELDQLGLPVLLIGDEPYYGRWGFSADHTGQWELPGPVDRTRLLLRCTDGARFDAPARISGSQGPGQAPDTSPGSARGGLPLSA